MEALKSSSFRVIVVGGGVTGLTAAHALQKANIDHVILERGIDPASPTGASIAIYPHGARILEQIGCLQAAENACVPMESFISRKPGGKAIMESRFFEFVMENHGYNVLLLERRAFLQLLYDCLPSKSRVRLGAKVTEVIDSVDGVEVRLADGTVEKGDMIIGCDGVHSMVRESMWDHANKHVPGLITAEEKRSVKTSWSCIIGMAPPTPGMGDRAMTCVHDKGYSFLTLTQPDKLFFFVFFRLKDPFTWPTRRRFTDEDADAAAASVAEHPISDTVVFGELWQKRTRGTMISLEEGTLKHWHFGRTVLAGDSAHKITPNIALGGNSSMESIVVLCNRLQRTLAQHSGARPSKATLNRVFAAYQVERSPRMHEIMEFSSMLTRLQAWDTPLLRFVATWVIPYQADRKIADRLGEIIRKAPRLEYVDAGRDCRRGRLAWADEEVGEMGGGEKGKEDANGTVGPAKVGWARSNLVRLAAAMAALTSFAWLIVVRSKS